MGAIQSAINQGLATAGILYSQSDLAEQRKKDFADKRELKDIDTQLSQLKPSAKALQRKADKLDNKEGVGEIPEELSSPELRKRERQATELLAANELYHGLSTKLSARKYELTKDPNDLKFALNQRTNQIMNQGGFSEVKAKYANERMRRDKEFHDAQAEEFEELKREQERNWEAREYYYDEQQ